MKTHPVSALHLALLRHPCAVMSGLKSLFPPRMPRLKSVSPPPPAPHLSLYSVCFSLCVCVCARVRLSVSTERAHSRPSTPTSEWP
jgi:hypothetical protein